MLSHLAFVYRYASRSLLRNRRRAMLTIGTIALSVMVSIIGSEYAAAVLKVWEVGAIDHGAAHIQVHVSGFDKHPDLLTRDLMLEDNSDIEQKIKSNSDVFAISKRIIFEGIISSGKKTLYFIGRAVEPNAELAVSPALFNPNFDEGQFVPSENVTGITIGRGLAQSLELKVGDEATIMTHTLSGSVNGIDVIVKGIIDFPVPTISKRLLYLHLAHAQKALSSDNRYSELAIRLKPAVDAEIWQQNFQQQLLASGSNNGFDIKGWWQIEPLIRRVESIWNKIMGLITSLLFVTAGISVLNIIFMMVAERTIEIGTLMSIGVRSNKISHLFTMEALLIGTLGAMCGGFLANLVLYVLSVKGVPFESPFASGNLVIYPKPNLVTTLVVSSIGIIICLAAALRPARKAAQVEPIVAFRGQTT